MDEAGGICGLLVVLVVIVLAFVAWFSVESVPPPAPAGVGAGAGDGGPIEPGAAWPIGRRGMVVAVGALYFCGLFLIRPRAIQAKRNGASNQQAALAALTWFAFSPVAVPVVLVWRGLGALGRALTSEPDADGKPRAPRGANDLD